MKPASVKWYDPLVKLSRAPTARLRLIALFAMVSVAYIIHRRQDLSLTEGTTSSLVVPLIGVAVGLLVLAEILPILRSLKFGGIEADFSEPISDKFNESLRKYNELDQRLIRIERDLKVSHAVHTAHEETKPAPAKERPVLAADDRNWHRFGGIDERGGFKLSATFRELSASWVEITLVVAASSTARVNDDAYALFYLHESFGKPPTPVRFQSGSAMLTVTAVGGFTVGVWIPSEAVELELDLSKVKGAPRVIREL